MENYVTSIKDTNQQTHLNAVIKALNCYVDSYENEKTNQPFGVINFCGNVSDLKIEGKPSTVTYISGCLHNMTLPVGVLNPDGSFERYPLTYCQCFENYSYVCYETCEGWPSGVTTTGCGWCQICSSPVNRTDSVDGEVITYTGTSECCYNFIAACVRKNVNTVVRCTAYYYYIIERGVLCSDASNANISIYNKYLV